MAGEIVSVGENVTRYKPGDRVYGSSEKLGAYAEFVCWNEKNALQIIPQNLNYKEAASIPYGALTALYFLQDLAKVTKGEKVLIKGASGGVGVYAVQLAKHFGTEVTAVCSTRNIEFVKLVGADKIIDYTKTDYTKTGEKWDVIIDIVVGKTSFKKNKNSLTKNGKYLAIAGGLNDMFQMVLTSLVGSKKVFFGGGSNCEKPENFNLIKQLIEAEKLKPIIDKSFTFEEMVEAHEYVESGTKKGNIVVQVYK